MTAPPAAVYLDRDGTLIELVDYLADPDRVVLCPGARTGLRRLREAGYRLVVISNQSGLARGFFQPSDLRKVEARIVTLLGKEAAPDLFLHCPHHPEGVVPRWRRRCECRKPEVGMVREAERRLGVRGGFLVGDSASDIECGRRAGLVTIRVRTGYGARPAESTDVPEGAAASPDAWADDIGAAAHWILECHPAEG